jgi:hypothetical protein
MNSPLKSINSNNPSNIQNKIEILPKVKNEIKSTSNYYYESETKQIYKRGK